MNIAIKKMMPWYKEYHRLNYTKQQITYIAFIKWKLFGSKFYWNKKNSCYVGMPKRLFIGKNSCVLRNNNFIQASGGIIIGNYVEFATRVSLLSANHDLYDQNISHTKPIFIGDYCWLGMNSSILAGVTLGPRTIVANGAVVTKSFPEGLCVLAGVPAKVVKRLDPAKFIPWTYKYEYYGFLPADNVELRADNFLEKYLDKEIFEISNNKVIIKQSVYEQCNK